MATAGCFKMRATDAPGQRGVTFSMQRNQHLVHGSLGWLIPFLVMAPLERVALRVAGPASFPGRFFLPRKQWATRNALKCHNDLAWGV